MIQLQGAGKRFGHKLLFEGCDWLITPKERTGLVGANGTGKSTLARELSRLTQGIVLSKDEIRAAVFAPKDIDYSVLFFLFFWALNVVDATVDGHLKDFDISNDLSLKIKPAFYSLPTTPLGVSFVFNIGKQPARHTPLMVP